MIKLNNSGVAFDSESHTYTLNGKTLQGITEMLSRQIFPDMYNGISEEVLANAARHGTMIHELCQLYDEMNIIPQEPQAQAYIGLAGSLHHVASEYLVTDGENHATAIDKVFEVEDGVVDLADIKTTSELHDDSVSWQLSIGREMFLKANPHLKVRKLLAIWLPKSQYGEPAIKEVRPIPAEEVNYLLMAEDSGEQYKIPTGLVNINTAIPTRFADLENEIYTRLSLIEKLTAEAEKFKANLKQAMEQENVVTWKSDRMTISRQADSVAKTFDSKKFKADYPELYADYLKETKRKGCIKIKIK